MSRPRFSMSLSGAIMNYFGITNEQKIVSILFMCNE